MRPTVSNLIRKCDGQNITETIDVKKAKCRKAGDDPLDSMRITNCIGCNEQLLLRVANPVCTNCRGLV